MAHSYSPWKKTKIINSQYLDILTIRPVPITQEDILYTIESHYHLRPDLLAFDLYSSSRLWWIFAQRNLDVIKDPVYDFVLGTTIYLPDPSAVKRHLG